MGKAKQPKLPKQSTAFNDAFSLLGNRTEQLQNQIKQNPAFLALTPQQRLAQANALTGGRALQIGGPGFATTLQTGGFTPFNPDDIQAQSLARQIARAPDPSLGQAQRLFQNNAGVSALRGINIGQLQQNATAALRGFSPSALQNANFGALQNFQPTALQNANFGALRGQNFGALRGFNSAALRGFRPSQLAALRFGGLGNIRSNAAFQQLQKTSQGGFLRGNPFLTQALAAAQQPVTQNFTTRIQPALAAQFGGGFGVGGSAAINAQRLAAQDLNRQFANQAAQVAFQNFNAERARQEAATQFLGQLDQSRALGLGQLQLGQASQLANIGLQRAQGLDSNALARAQSLGQLGLQRATSLGQLQLGRAQSLGQLGLQRASNLGQLQLGRAQSLGELGLSRAKALAQSGLDFTNSRVTRGKAIGNLQNTQAQGLLDVGTQRRAQQVQAQQLLSQIGAQRRAQQAQLFNALNQTANAPVSTRLARLQGVSSILGSPSGVSPSQIAPGRNRLSGALGGGVAGAGAGFALGGVPGAIIGGGLGVLGGVI